jgi:RNA polymerase sigma-70 factor (ECF subfamily)
MSIETNPVKNEADAFQRLYDANRQRISRFLAYTAGSEEAEDLAQVVFAKAARGLPNFRGDAQASTWLYRIAANVASDWLRGRTALEAKVTVQLPNALDHAACGPSASPAPQESQTSPEQELIRKEMGDCIRRVIGQLPDTHRTVLVLGELGGFTDDEVAETLGISRGNAKVRLHRARAQLRNALEARCDFSHDEDNEFVCEPKPATCHASSKRSGRSSPIKSNAQPGSEAL